MNIFTTAYLSCRPSFPSLARVNIVSPFPVAAARMHHHRSASVGLAKADAGRTSAFAAPGANGSTGSTGSTRGASTHPPLAAPKRLLLLRHGQAAHNPRAEDAREKGCSFETFLQLMMEDDQRDSALTELGVTQATDAGRQGRVRRALRDVELVVSSPLSRALSTADLVLPPSDTGSLPRRVCVETFREINGKLLNAQRRPRSDLERIFPRWCFRQIPAVDESWTEELESTDACSERGYNGLLWIMQQPETNVLLVCHGGLLSYTLNSNSKVVLVDGRKHDGETEVKANRCVTKRFGNCELREFVLTVSEPEILDEQQNGNSIQPLITLEEVTMEMEESGC